MKSIVIVAATLVAANVLAAPFKTIVNGTPAGDLTVTCNDASAWKISAASRIDDGCTLVTFTLVSDKPAQPPRFKAAFSFPQRDMHHVYVPCGNDRAQIFPDWGHGFGSELAYGAPIMAILDERSQSRMTFACSEALKRVEFKAGLREEKCLVAGYFEFFVHREAPANRFEVTLRIDPRTRFWSDAVADASRWITEKGGLVPCAVPDDAFAPLYSSWYQFHQNVFDRDIEAECAIASKLGMKVLIVDDGWQTDDASRGYAFCGDWQISKRRFPDMRAHVAKVHAMGMKYMMWYSVPFVGYKSANFERFKGKYLYDCKGLNAYVLDPRFPEVREFLVGVYEKALRDWDLDGFKLDFIDSFGFRGPDPAVADNYAGRDIKVLSDAIDLLMRTVKSRLDDIKPGLLFEFRQSYMGPAIRQYGNMLRAADCPGDLQGNRMRIASLRATSCGTPVHADMLEWNESESVENAA